MAATAPETPVLSVTELTRRIKAHLELGFQGVWVEGEISNLRAPASGHLYLSLKDENAQLRCVLFRSAFRSLKFTPKDGQRILCRGRITVYEPRGDYQLILERLEPRGIGALQLAFEQLKERLQKEGLFAPSHKKPIPLLPRRIGIVTSPTGAALRDILQVLRRRFANLYLLINPVPVQGEGAAAAIADAIDELNARGRLDVLIVARGGGSIEDLWAFNEEPVARAIFRSEIPVISAVGHEVDYTIADFVSDLRAPTPSAAAEMVIQTKKEFADRIRAGVGRVARAVRHRLALGRSRLSAGRRVLRDPRGAIEAHLLRLDELEGRLGLGMIHGIRYSAERWRRLHESLRSRSPMERLHRLATQAWAASKRLDLQMRYYLARKKSGLESAAGALDGLSPLAILSRGYSITRKLPGMELIKEAGAISKGERVHVRLHLGSLICHVEEKTG